MKDEIKEQSDFDYYWSIDEKFIDEINRRGKGWSGVIITRDEKTGDRICIKKQEDYVSYSLLHPIKGTPTTEKELNNLNYCAKNGISAPKVVYYGQRLKSGINQAILVTSFLENSVPLNDIIDKKVNGLFSDKKSRRNLISKVAAAVRRLHAIRLTHGNLYPKHIFVDSENSNISFIDLEKSKIKMYSSSCVLRDLDTLNRRSPTVSKNDKLAFLKAYYDSDTITPEIRKIWTKLAKAAEKKFKKRSR